MENELTPLIQMPYPDRYMEDGAEGGTAVAERVETAATAELEPREITEVDKQALLEKLERNIQERINQGRPMTEEQIAAMRVLIERGQVYGSPTARIAQGFQYFNAAKYKNVPALKELGDNIKIAGKFNKVDQNMLNKIDDTLNLMEVRGMDSRLIDEFKRDLTKIINGEIPQPQYEDLTEEQKIDLKRGHQKERGATPNSIQDVARTIIIDEGEDKWGIDGEFPLMDERGNINKTNFLKWARERMMYHHKNNPRDLELRLGNVVGVDTELGSTISVFQMDKSRGKYFKDERSGKQLDDLANQLKNEIFLFGNMRRYNLIYQEAMGNDADIAKFLTQVHNIEELTDSDNLKIMMTLPSRYVDPQDVKDLDTRRDKKEITQEKYEELKEGLTTDTKIGDALRKSYEIYFHIADINELKKLLGENSVFFKKEGMENAFRIMEKKARGADISDNAKAIIAQMFNGDTLIPKKFIENMNPFNLKNKPSELVKLTQEMVRQAVAEKYGLEYGLDKNFEPKVNARGKEIPSEREYLRGDLEYAEAFAWVLTRFTGAGARNDTGAIGFDALTKGMKLQQYRERQSSEKRAGQFGNEYDLPVFRTLITDLFNGITVEKKQGDPGNITPFELFQQLDAIEDEAEAKLKTEKDPLKQEKIKQKEIDDKAAIADRFKFEKFTQKGYAGDHLGKSWEIFHSIMGAEEMRLEEIVKWDPFRGIILDKGKFEEQVKEKFLKPIRYAFNTHAQLDFGKMTTMQTKERNEDGTIKYKTVTVADKTFGPIVTNGLKEEMIDHWKKEIQNKKKEKWTPLEKKIMEKNRFSKEEKEELWPEYVSGVGRELLWKRAAMARFALQLKSHRQFGNGYAPFTEGMVETFYDALESIKAAEVVGDNDDEKVKYGERFLTEKDIEWIRKMSGTGKARMFWTETFPRHIAWGLGKGAWEGGSDFIKGIFK